MNLKEAEEKISNLKTYTYNLENDKMVCYQSEKRLKIQIY